MGMDLFEKDKGKPNKPKMGFNILSGDSTSGHGGYGAGVLNLDHVTPVFVNPTDREVFIDMGGLHARSAVERRIKFTHERDAVPNPKLYWLVWVTIGHKEGKPYYAGVTACEMTVDEEARRGYKSLPEHVNRMDKSLKGHIIIEDMDDVSKQLLGTFLKEYNEAMWDLADEKIRQGLLGE